MDAKQILKVKIPEKIFSNSKTAAKKEFHELSKAWHPDVNKSKEAAEVFQHVSALYKKAVEKIDSGTWETVGIYQFKQKDGKDRSIKYRTMKIFELGRFYVGDDHVTYLVDSKFRNLYNNALNSFRSFRYGSDKMRDEVSRYLPKSYTTFETQDGCLGLKVDKTNDLILLRDVLNHYKGRIDIKHVGWIQNTLHNLSCYFNYTGITHNDISPDTYFISPKFHSGALLGGWWYSLPNGSPISQVPRRTANFIPWEVKNKKKASIITDLELVKATGREILGDISGKRFVDVPKQMSTKLNTIASKDAIAEYKSWGDTLNEALGPKKFHVMDLTADHLYND